MKKVNFLLRNGHIMTIAASLWPRRLRLSKVDQRIFKMDDQTSIVVKCHWQPDAKNAPTVILVHGLEGSAERPYMLGSAQKAFEAGFNALRTNVRNCGNTEHLTPTLYHSGFTHDLRSILFELIEKDNLQQIFFLGFSMGGNQILKLAGELGKNTPSQLKGLCAISPAIDLAAACRSIGSFQNRIYERNFLKGLKQKVRIKNRLFKGRFSFKGVQRAGSMWEFDELVTAPYWGYKSALEYYQDNSSLKVLHNVACPSLILRAKDDPFVPALDYESAQKNPWIQDQVMPYGGHLGFMRIHSFFRPEFWAENKAIEFFKSIARSSLDE